MTVFVVFESAIRAWNGRPELVALVKAKRTFLAIDICVRELGGRAPRDWCLAEANNKFDAIAKARNSGLGQNVKSYGKNGFLSYSRK